MKAVGKNYLGDVGCVVRVFGTSYSGKEGGDKTWAVWLRWMRFCMLLKGGGQVVIRVVPTFPLQIIVFLRFCIRYISFVECKAWVYLCSAGKQRCGPCS